MEKEEFEKWTGLFENYRKERDETLKTLLRMSEKFGRLAEGTKKELEKVTEHFSKPYYKTDGFYKSVILASAILLSVGIASLTKTCLQLKIGEYFVSANCHISSGNE